MRPSDCCRVNWRTLAVIEGVLLIVLIPLLLRLRVSVVHTYESVGEPNPLMQAVFYEAPLRRFEELAHSESEWINLRNPDLPSGQAMTILEYCAQRGMEDHLSILIGAGADVTSSMAWLRTHGLDDAAEILERAATPDQPLPDTGGGNAARAEGVAR